VTHPKSNSNKPTAVCTLVIEGEVLRPAVLDAAAMCQMNFARIEHKRLERLLRTIVIPMVGGYETELGQDLARHLEQVRTFSGNFCFVHRHIGASYGVVGQRPGIDKGVRRGQ